MNQYLIFNFHQINFTYSIYYIVHATDNVFPFRFLQILQTGTFWSVPRDILKFHFLFFDRPYYRPMAHDDYSTVDTDIPVAEEDGSAGYHDLYDLTYNAAGSQKVSGQMYPGPSNGNGMPPPGRFNRGSYPYVTSYKQMSRLPSLVNHNNYLPPNTNYQFHNPNNQIEQYNIHNPLQQIQMIYEKADWRKIGILALVKLGLIKLKLFSFLKLLFLLVFKLKLFLIAMFFKYLLIAKLMKLFKLLMLPLLSLVMLPLMSTVTPMLLGGLLSIPSRLIELLTGPVFVPDGNTIIKNSAADPTVLPSATSAAAKTLSPVVFKIDDLNLVDMRRLNPLGLHDPSMNIFRKLLDLDKCVERIACRIAVVEKAGVLPLWVNW